MHKGTSDGRRKQRFVFEIRPTMLLHEWLRSESLPMHDKKSILLERYSGLNPKYLYKPVLLFKGQEGSLKDSYDFKHRLFNM